MRNVHAMVWDGAKGATRLNRLFDIALFIERHDVDWNLILKRAREWHRTEELYYTARLVNHIFEGFIPLWFINEVESEAYHNYKHNSVSYIKKMAMSLLDFDLDELLLGNVNDHLVMAGNTLLSKKTLYCRFAPNHQTEDMATANRVLLTKMSLDPNLDCRVDIRMKWDSENLYISVGFHGNVMELEKCIKTATISIGPGDYYCNWQVSRFIRCIVLPIYWADDLEHITAKWDYFELKAENNQPEHRYPYSVIKNDRGYMVNITMPWTSLGIIPKSRKKLWFEFYVKIRKDVEDSDYFARYAFADFYNGPWDDHSKLGQLELC